MPKKKPYTHESIRRALDHHKVEYRLAWPIDLQLERPFHVETGIGTVEMTEHEAYFYVIGLADRERLDGRTREWFVVDTGEMWGPLTEVDAKAKQSEINASRNGCDAVVVHESVIHHFLPKGNEVTEVFSTERTAKEDAEFKRLLAEEKEIERRTRHHPHQSPSWGPWGEDGVPQS